MATIDMVVNQRMNAIRRVIDKGLVMIIGEEIRESILYRLETNFYSMGYGNRGDLAKSIKVGVEMLSKDSFVVNVYFNDNKIRHTSWFGSATLGISAGDTVYSVSWINDGWSYIHGDRRVRLHDVGKEPHFMEDALSDLEKDKSWIEKFYAYLRQNGIDVQN